MSTNSTNTSEDERRSDSVVHNDDGKEEEDDGSSSAGSKRSSTENTENSPNNSPRLASEETRAVTWSKFLMVLILLAVAAAAATVVFKYTTSQEEEDFEVRFTDFANQVIGVYEVNAAKIIDAYENFALQASATAIATESQWPFVVLPAFEAQASRLMEQTGARTIATAHIVKPEQLGAWVNFTSTEYGWIQEGLDYVGSDAAPRPPPPFLFGDWRNFAPLFETFEGYDIFFPFWQGAPIATSNGAANFDALRTGTFPGAYDRVMELNGPVLTQVRNLDRDTGFGTTPESVILAPIYSNIAQHHHTDEIVGVLSSILPWQNYFYDLLPDGIDGIILVMSNTCNQTWSYEINGSNVTFLGSGDWHADEYTDYLVDTAFSPFGNEMECAHTLSLYPSEKFESSYETNKPTVYTIAVLSIFLLTVGVFLLYDCLVERRQEKVLSTAERSTAIVTSLFPQQVADKLMRQEQEKEEAAKKKKKPAKPVMLGQAAGGMMGSNMNGPVGGDFPAGDIEVGLNDETTSKPIAELFPTATVLFADIVGFTAWSSSREPSQVFELLEEIYSSFDSIARRKKVFKVETIGDCYMAATGLPEKRDDHAILMARFARDCLRKMLHVVRKLEVRLGPDTADLGMRIGIHSGPVTAGVLRGEKARFQLFGDTVNTAARMESTGAKNKIHITEETAEMIRAAQHKDIWTVPRQEQIEAKGKGKMNTHWLAYTSQGGKSASSAGTRSVDGSMSFSSDTDDNSTTTEFLEDSKQKKLDRSIDWGVDILQRLLKRVVAMRGGIKPSVEAANKYREMPKIADGTSPLEEVKTIIELPSQERGYPVSPSNIDLPPQVFIQLRDFVKTIASMYQQNPFHSFEHATHVTQSVTKLLTRVVAPDVSDSDRSRLHQYTYGITSDPLAQFAVAFSALIHDVDHPGVPNATLVQEQTSNAVLYKNKSVAEQNSVDVAWELLSEPYYAEFRACIFTNEAEFQRFRQLVVNTVMATDIVDQELGAARKKRWEAAFAESVDTGDGDSEAVLDANRKATIVIEHLIQASDVAHTMQHWHVYLKWNQRFFNECYKGFLECRTDKDPSEGWYQGELGFFDFYIIPLAKKLKECQVFGVASDEYLQYAEANRREWEEKGEELVRSYLDKYLERQKSSQSRC